MVMHRSIHDYYRRIQRSFGIFGLVPITLIANKIKITRSFDAAQSFKVGTEGTVHYVAEAVFQDSNYSLG